MKSVRHALRKVHSSDGLALEVRGIDYYQVAGCSMADFPYPNRGVAPSQANIRVQLDIQSIPESLL
jgi:hypothetical protein